MLSKIRKQTTSKPESSRPRSPAERAQPQRQKPAKIDVIGKLAQQQTALLKKAIEGEDGTNPAVQIAERLQQVELAQNTIIEEIAQLKAAQEEVIRGQNLLLESFRDLLHS